MSNYFIESVFILSGKCYSCSRILGSASSCVGDTFRSGGKLVLLPCFSQFSGDTGKEMSILGSKSWQEVAVGGKPSLYWKGICREHTFAAPLE